MYLRCAFIFLLVIVRGYEFQQIKNNFNDDSQNEPHSFLRDVQFADNDTCLAVNFENVNERQLPFYLHCEDDYKFNMEQFTEDFVQVKFINLVNATEQVNGTVSLKKVHHNLTNESEDELVHYELLMNSTKHLSNFCWNMSYERDHHWYGALNLHNWPLDSKITIKEQPYITSGFFKNSTGSVVEYVWFSSTGYLVFVERNVPLSVKLENEILCLSSKHNVFPYVQANKKSQQVDRAPFKAHIIVSRDIKQAYTFYLENFVKKPERSPNPKIYSSNIWSTWVKFKRDINQQNLIEFAKNISSYGFNKYGSIFEIDDKWEANYGSLKFDKDRFPNAKQMIAEIKKLGFNTSVWVTPFFNPEVVDTFSTEELEYMVKELNSRQIKRLDWWCGENATLVDPTNPRARRWYIKRLRKFLTEHNIDTFKEDAGEIHWLKTPFKLFDQDADSSPNKFSEYISLMIRDYENSSSIELRTSFNSQSHGNLVRVLDKDSNWSYDNGFKSLIPNCLTYSIMGYPFILPDMIGGNMYNEEPDRELYLRWLAVNSLLPVMQYSIAPFDFDDEVVRIALKFQDLHNEFVPLFVELAENAKKTGHPIIRPMWWIAPNDTNTWTIDDQFIIGNDVIVAPIVEQNQTRRSIYLPSGQWSDKLRNLNLTGPQLVENYEIKLDEIAYFTRLD